MKIKIKSLHDEVLVDSVVSDKVYVTLDQLVNEEFNIPCNTAKIENQLEDTVR